MWLVVRYRYCCSPEVVAMFPRCCQALERVVELSEQFPEDRFYPRLETNFRIRSSIEDIPSSNNWKKEKVTQKTNRISSQLKEKPLKIKEISYSLKAYLASSVEEHVTLTAQVEPDDNPEEILDCLKNEAWKLKSPTVSNLNSQIKNLKAELIDLQQKVKHKTAEWNSISDFLKAQGINPKAPQMPLFSSSSLLPAATEEVCEGEFEDGNSNDIPM